MRQTSEKHMSFGVNHHTTCLWFLVLHFVAVFASAGCGDDRKSQSLTPKEEELLTKASAFLSSEELEVLKRRMLADREHPLYDATLGSLLVLFDGFVDARQKVAASANDSRDKTDGIRGTLRTSRAGLDAVPGQGVVDAAKAMFGDILDASDDARCEFLAAGMGYGIGVLGGPEFEVGLVAGLGGKVQLQNGVGYEVVYDFKHFAKANFASTFKSSGAGLLIGECVPPLELSGGAAGVQFHNWIFGFSGSIDEYGHGESMGVDITVEPELKLALGLGVSLGVGGWKESSSQEGVCSNPIPAEGGMYGFTYAIGASWSATAAECAVFGLSVTGSCSAAGAPSDQTDFLTLKAASPALAPFLAGMAMATDIMLNGIVLNGGGLLAPDTGFAADMAILHGLVAGDPCDGGSDDIDSKSDASLTQSELVMHLAFDEGTGDVAHDGGTGGNDGLLLDGASWGAGKCGSAVSLEGNEDSVEIPSSPQLNLGDEYTVSYWVWFDSWDPGWQSTSGAAVLTKHEIYDDANGWMFWIRNSDPARLEFISYSIEGAVVSTQKPIETGRWYHVAVTGSKTGGEVTLYLDGAEENSVPFWSIVANTHPVVLGRELGMTGRQFDGRVDELRIYSRALSPSELSALYSGACHE